jgi:uncharacterized protein involved in exopolysaccharide biosynthesis
MNELLTVATVLAIVIGALLASAPSVSLALVRSRGRGLPASLSVRLTEEWSGELDAIPDRAAKLAFAIGIRLTRRKSLAVFAEDNMTPVLSQRPSLFSFFGGWKTVIAVPTILAALVAYATSFLIEPQYRADALILVVPQRVPEEYVKSTVTTRIQDRLQAIANQILSRTRLERIIQDFNLFEKERANGGAMEDLIDGMRDNIGVKVERGDAFRVSYVGREPTTVQKVTERLATLFINESLKDREVLAEGTSQFLEANIEELRRRLIEQEKHVAAAVRKGSDETAVLRLEYEMLETRYKDLLMKLEDSRLAANLEHLSIGEQFKLLDSARRPERPFTPNRLNMTLIGAVTGLCFGIAMMMAGWGRRKGRPEQAVAQ